MVKLPVSLDTIKEWAPLIGGIVVVGILAIVVYRYLAPSSMNGPPLGFNEGFASQSSASSAQGSSGYKLVMFGVDWCPHCVKTSPIFANLGSTQTVAGKTVQIQKINPETEENPYKDTVKVSGFPTIVLIDPAGAVTEYEGPRTQEGFLEFLAAHVK